MLTCEQKPFPEMGMERERRRLTYFYTLNKSQQRRDSSVAPGQRLLSVLSPAQDCGETGFLPSEEEGDVKRGAVQIDKLKKKHFQGEAVLPLRLCARLFCG